ncbi:MAG: M4 family metallopeptidase [Bacteroidota bacterium]
MQNINKPTCKWLLTAACLLIFLGSSGQSNRLYSIPASDVLTGKTTPGWYYFDEEKKINALGLFKTYSHVFGLSGNDEMRLIKSNTDAAGNIHSKYKQYYKGLPVEATMLIVHARANNTVYLVNGNIIRGLNLPAASSINENAALQKALLRIPAKTYLWQDARFEDIKKKAEKNPAATNYPRGTLCIYPTTRNEDMLTQDFSVGWFFDIYVKDGTPSSRVFVDAINGQIKNMYRLGYECTAGTATTVFNGSRTINTKLVSGNYNLINDCQTTVIHTYDLINDTAVAQRLEFADADNSWTAFSQQSPVQTHFAAEQTYNYFKIVHGRNSWDGANGEMTSYHGVRGSSYANACWGCLGNVAQFGIGPSGASNADDWNTLDIVGHEFTHGVVGDETGMPYYAQSGGLDESFADIFGEMTEQRTEGLNEGNAPWLVGEDRGGALRSFWNPNAASHPDTYKGSYWFNTDTCNGQAAVDNCGVHTNSGVQNHWFYLLAKGGSGTNDNGEPFAVTGIGNEKARAIAYQSLVAYITNTSKYIDARNSAVRAAEDLYGVCSNEAIQCAKAWFAVGGDVESALYDRTAFCTNYNSNAGTTYFGGIRSLTISPFSPFCSFVTETATTYPLIFQAGKFIRIASGVDLKSTGTQPLIIAPDDCAYTNF